MAKILTDQIHLDTVKSIYGTGSDLQIYHDGSNSYIADSGQGGTVILTNRFELLNAGGNEYMIVADDNSSVDLYYDNSLKLQTSSTGVTITGTATLTPANATGDPDKFLCVNSNGVVQYRTGTQVRSDIGAGTSSTVGTVTQVSTGTGLDGQFTTSGTISLDLSELNDIDGDDPQITDFVVVSNEDESARCSLANTKIALGANKSQFVLNSNFSDDSSTTSYIYMPFNTTSDTTSAQYYVHWAAPCTGRIKRIIMQHVYGSMSSGFTTQLQVYKGGSTFTTSGELTATSTNDGGYIEYNPTGSNVEFVKGDRIRIRYSKNTTSKYWRGVAASIIMELDQV
jgi:hypothetical protein|tara:strand:+ start:2170 stop:3189 length:1020 start_codon:yes stop_codon:yes gene_type:complete